MPKSAVQRPPTVEEAEGIALETPEARQEKYVQNLLLGLSKSEAAVLAGYAPNTGYLRRLDELPYVKARLAEVRADMVKKYDFTRDRGVDMAMEIYEMSKVMADSQGMVNALRELNKMFGHYAPEKKQLQIGVTDNNKLMEQLESMPERELLSIIEGEVVDTPKN